MKIYKYAPLDKAKLILESGEVISNKPKAFNDIYDCVFKQDPKDKLKIQKLLKDYATLLTIVEVAKIPEVQNALPVRFFNFQFSVLKLILKKIPSYTGTPGLMIVYNMMVKKKPEIGTIFDTKYAQFQEKLDAAIERAKKDVIISCFSTRNDSLLMWSHYADSHFGVCFEYDKPEINEFYDVDYSDKRPSIKLFKAVARVIANAITENKEIKEIHLEDIEEIAAPFKTKSLDWAYEKEVRGIFSIKHRKKYGIEKKDDRYLFPIGEPTAIYLGCRCNEEAKGYTDFMKVVAEHKTKIVRMKPSEATFDILVDEQLPE